MSTVFNKIRTIGDVKVGGNLEVLGTTTSLDTKNVTVEDSHMYLNSNATTALAGGLAINVLPGAGAAVSGLAFATTTTVEAAGAGLSVGDYIQITDAANIENNGLFKVLSYVDPLITLDTGVTTGPGTPFQNAFVVDPTVAGTVTPVTLAAIQASATSGTWEIATGSSGAFTWEEISTGGSGTFVRVEGDPSGTQTASGSASSFGGDGELVLRAKFGALTGVVSIPTETEATDSTDGALTVAGGVGIAKNLFVGGDFTLEDGGFTVNPGATSTGAVNIIADAGGSGAVNIGNGTNTTTLGSGTVTVTNATLSLNGGASTANVGINDGTGSGSVTIGNTTAGDVTLDGAVLFNRASTGLVETIATNTTVATVGDLRPIYRFTGPGTDTLTLPAAHVGMEGMVITFVNAGTAAKTINLGTSTWAGDSIDVPLSSVNDSATLRYDHGNTAWYSV